MRPLVESVRLQDGLRIVCPPDRPGGHAPGDPVEAYVGDHLIGRATLEAEGDILSAHIGLTDVPELRFPASLRVMNVRAVHEIGLPLVLPDEAALIVAAGAPCLLAAFAGLDPLGPAFTVTIDRLPRYARDFVLHLDGQPAATARSAPAREGSTHRVVFPLTGSIAPDTIFAVAEIVSGVTALSGRFDMATSLAGAMAQLAAMSGRVDALEQASATLRRRLDTALDLGRAALLLDRLDLFYLLLSERIDRAAPGTRPEPVFAGPPAVRVFAPADIDGIGIFDVETDGSHEWRWFGPDATIALRDVPWPARRVVLYFHGFGDAPEPPSVRVSIGGPPETARLRFLQGRYALNVPVPRRAASIGGMLILHLSFDRHQTSQADPRLLSAVFSGAEVVAASA